MTDIRVMNDTEIGKRIIWIENEIDTCLECDLPTIGLEIELSEMMMLLESRNSN